MRRIWLPLLVTVLLAACGSAPQQNVRKPAPSASTANRTYKPPAGFPTFVDHSVGREEISIQAMALVGVPYRWGGNTPDAGFDCSGLVRYVVDRAASVNLPRTTADMSTRGESIEPDEVAPGDLIFFNTTGRPHSHVGIYVGKLRFVNAPSTGGTVRLDYLTNPYWAKRFDGIRRVAPPKSAPTPFDAPTYQAASPAQPAASVGVATRVAAAPYVRPADAFEPPLASATNAQRQAEGAAQQTSDAFEPPPASLTAAQRQAQGAASIASSGDPFEPPPASSNTARRQAPSSAPSYDAFEPPPSSLNAAQRQAQAAGATTPAVAAINAAPDPIQAAADAFEPPPSTSRAARQQARTAQAAAPAEAGYDAGYNGAAPVRVMRASTGSLAAPRPVPADDPIARFATGPN